MDDRVINRALTLPLKLRMMLLGLVKEHPILQDHSSNQAKYTRGLCLGRHQEVMTMNPDLPPRTTSQLKRCYNRIKLR
ncbi:hypothetical protein Pmani_032427 [Petrolisthes manimaculis]|uniref:Uncharacterized protein n=1 Tax=Petrolisthes manimaculis TaxID=1843537 RepID=A0AAE1NTN5_9EUCA|nr:hypothetical protein Pmani_032427 [Petrolisthes manimaculis]